jgi:hypothetical protein
MRGLAFVGQDFELARRALGNAIAANVLAQMKVGYIRLHVDQQPYLQGHAPVVQARLTPGAKGTVSISGVKLQSGSNSPYCAA